MEEVIRMQALPNDSETAQQRLVRTVHQEFATAVSTSLSTFLQAEIAISFESASFTFAGAAKAQLLGPACFLHFELFPRAEWALLSFDNTAAFGLLELLLGVTMPSMPAEARAFTEIEWSLLEEVVRAIAAPLGNAWKAFHAVEFKVKELESDPARLSVPDGTLPVVHLTYTIQLGEQRGSFAIAVPQTFFDVVPPQKPAAIEPPASDIQRNFELLQEAQLDFEVVLEGPTLSIHDVARLAAGQVLQFDYPLEKPLLGVLNGKSVIAGQIVTVGRKRGFQLEHLL